ncbi:MAG: hypothetical protein WEE89_11240 [Gemmatimonadota bacterium]
MANATYTRPQTGTADTRVRFLPFVRVTGRPQPQATVGEDAITMFLAGFALFALFLDGWRHNNTIGIDTFWALPHTLMYSGLGALGVWLTIVLWRYQKSLSELDWSAVPHGYGLAFVALPLAMLAGNADFQWHASFGFENQIDSTYSPPHQMLFLAGTLLGSIPAASAWQRRGVALSLGTLLPALISVSSIVVMTIFVIHQSTPFYGVPAMTPAFQQDIAGRADAYAPGSEAIHIEGLSPALIHYGDEAFPYYFYSTHHTVNGLLLTSFMLLGGVLVMRRRWQLPFGAMTIMFTWMAWQFPILSAGREWTLAPSLVLAGLVGDVLLASLVGTRGPMRIGRIRVFSALLPVVIWGLFLLCVAMLGDGLAWGATLWTGILTTSAAFGYALSFLVFPPGHGTAVEQVPAAAVAD